MDTKHQQDYSGWIRIIVALLICGYLLAWFWPWPALDGVVSNTNRWIALLASGQQWLLSALPGPLWLLALLALVLFAARRGQWVYFAALLVGFGFASVQVAERVGSVAVLDQRVDCAFSGVVTGLVDEQPDRIRFNLKPTAITAVDADAQTCPEAQGLLRASIYHADSSLQSGQQIDAVMRLRPNHGFANPGGFDYPRWLFRHNIIASGYILDGTLSLSGHAPGLQARVDRLRDYLSRRLQQAIEHTPGSVDVSAATALLAGLSMGDRQYLTDAHWSALLATGTNHLLAISGLHVGMMAGLFGFLAQKLWRHSRLADLVPAQRAGAAAAVIAAWSYALIAGLSIPTMRAALMLTILLAGLLFQRRWRLFDLWLLAMLAVLLLDPAAPLDVGFWLSFTAVLVIIFAVQTRPPSRWAFFALVSLQVLLFIGLLPITWGLFDRIPWMSLPANLIAVPLVTLLLTPLALLILLIAVIYPPAGGGLIWLVAYIANLLFWLLESLVAFGPDTLIAAPPLPALLLLTLGCIWLLMPKGWPGKPLAWLLLLPAVVAADARPEPGSIHLTVFDVGQGTAIHIQTEHADYLYDVGPRWGDFDTGETVVLPALRTLGVSRLDKIVLSHRHLDHVGGLPAVHAQFPQTPIWGEPAPDDQADISYRLCEDGYQWRQDGVLFTLKQAPFRDANEGSCVLAMQLADNTRVLLTGDIERAAEHWLLRHYPMQADVVYVPHHGSSSSSTPAFVDRVDADIAFNSAGMLNRFNHPEPEVVARWQAQGADFYNTSEHGALFWNSHGVATHRAQRWPFAWRVHGQ